MSLSTLSAGQAPAAEQNLLAEESESAENGKPACPPVALSTLAKERLTLLNRVLANCVPKSAASDPVPKEADWR